MSGRFVVGGLFWGECGVVRMVVDGDGDDDGGRALGALLWLS